MNQSTSASVAGVIPVAVADIKILRRSTSVQPELRRRRPPVAKVAALLIVEPEIQFLHVVPTAEVLGASFQRNSPVLDDAGGVGITQRDRRVLFGDKETDSLLAIQSPNDLENLLDDQRRETHRWFV